MDIPPPSPSLWERLREHRAEPPGPAAWRVTAAVALLLACGPVLTVAGAKLLTMRALDAADMQLRQAGANPVAGDARGQFAALLKRPGAAATLEALARVLPADVVVERVERGADDRLALDALAPDPDRLRGALRRDPVSAGLRDVGQRSGDGGIVVTLEEAR